MKKFMLVPAVLDVVRFTVTPTAARTVTLDGLTPPFAGLVDWGDGAVSPLVSGAALSHNYANTTPRQIAVRGVVGGFWNTTASVGKNLVTSLDEISSRSLVTLQNAFRGCTTLRTVSTAFLMPNVANFNYTFYQNHSIVSELPPLWLMFPAVPHTGCFTDCFKSLYGQYGSGCSYRQYVSAIPGQTYFQRYGTGCSATNWVASMTYGQVYGYNTACPLRYQVTGEYVYRCRGGMEACNPNKCWVVYSEAYYRCIQSSASGTSICNGNCSRTYQYGQSAYYRCTRSGGTCQASSCPYPYANETSYNNARAKGWA